jgi:hypothetical protein
VNAVASSYAIKQLRITFTLSNSGQTFSDNVSNQLVLSDLRAEATINGGMLPSFPDAKLRVYGMLQADMNRLSALTFQPLGVNPNSVQIEANSGNGYSTVFAGQITNAFVDYSGSPEVALQVNARVLGLQAMSPATATSYTGGTSVATIVSAIAAKMGYSFQNDGVDTQLSNPYYSGTLAKQLADVCTDAGIDLYTDQLDGIIVICPHGQPRTTPTFILSPASGLVGYPTVDSQGLLQCRAFFNPAFRLGGTVTIAGSDVVIDLNQTQQTILERANGTWQIYNVVHALEALKFGGAWYSDLGLFPPGTLQPGTS